MIKKAVFICVVASLSYAKAAASPAVIAASPAIVSARLEEFDPVPQYRFGYDVADSLTGDYKSQQEQRDGDIVQGQYSFVEADGTRRVVDYSADPVNGFNAIVRNEPLVTVQEPAIVAERVVKPARVIQTSQPIVAARVAAPVVAKPADALLLKYTVPSPVIARLTAPVQYRLA